MEKDTIFEIKLSWKEIDILHDSIFGFVKYINQDYSVSEEVRKKSLDCLSLFQRIVKDTL